MQTCPDQVPVSDFARLSPTNNRPRKLRFYIEMLVKDLAAWLGAAWEGDGEADLGGVAPIEDAGQSDLSFVTLRWRTDKSFTSGAGCLLVPVDFPHEAGRTVIRTPDPRGSMARAISKLHPTPAIAPGIHSTAVIDAAATIAKDAYIGPLVTLGAGVRVGAG